MRCPTESLPGVSRRRFCRGAAVGAASALLGGGRLRSATAGRVRVPQDLGDEPVDGSPELVNLEAFHAIQNGLEWLASHQDADGSFGKGSYRAAITSLAGIAFMANGSTPGRGPYGRNISEALDYVLSCADASGFITSPPPSNNPMYGHGFATLFLAEVYGMTQRQDVRETLDRAVRLIIDTQNEEGGWRYQPVRADADLSVTICQINALRAARNAGLFIPKETVEACIDYVKQAQNPDGGFRYMLRSGNSAFPRSAAGIVALYSASIYDDEAVDAGIAYLKMHRPDDRFLRRLPHYFYGHYYAVQAMWIRGGEDWNSWYPAIRDELLDSQAPNGSWTDSVGDDYATAMALIILQVPFGCLPIFQR